MGNTKDRAFFLWGFLEWKALKVSKDAGVEELSAYVPFSSVTQIRKKLETH